MGTMTPQPHHVSARTVTLSRRNAALAVAGVAVLAVFLTLVLRPSRKRVVPVDESALSVPALPSATARGTPASIAPVATPPADPLRGNLSGVYRAMKELSGATSGGINYVRFGELLGRCNAELSIAKDRQLTPAEREALGMYATAITVYSTSSEVWHMGIESTDTYGLILVSNEKNSQLRGMAEAFGLSFIDNADRSGKQQKAYTGMAWPQTVWIHGSTAASELWPQAEKYVSSADEELRK